MPDQRPGTPRLLTRDELALEAGATPAYVDELVAAGAIGPDGEGLHEAADVRRVRLALALAEGGIDTEGLVWAIGAGLLPLDRVTLTWATPEPTSRTFGALVLSLGERGDRLPDVYTAFGLAVPGPESVVSDDEADVLQTFLDAWATVDDRPEVAVRAAHIAGDGIRRLQEATLDLFDEFGGSPPTRLRRGMSVDEAMQPSIDVNAVMGPLVAWLLARHSEVEIFGRIVPFIERHAAEAGRLPRRVGGQPAIAFVDLAGYTQLTEAAGDQHAAALAAVLQQLAGSAVRDHRGRVVKLLGDGVMLRFPSPGDGVRAVLELMTAVESAGLPRAHAGLASGPIVARDADVYGRTVNLAARIAGHAAPGELLVPADLEATLGVEGFAMVGAGEARLKGISDPVPLARVVLR